MIAVDPAMELFLRQWRRGRDSRDVQAMESVDDLLICRYGRGVAKVVQVKVDNLECQEISTRHLHLCEDLRYVVNNF